MNKFIDFLEKHFVPITYKLNRNKYLMSVRDGFVVTIPMIIFGSIVLLIPNLPFLDKVIGESSVAVLSNLLGHSSTITMNLTTIIVSYSIAYNFCKRNKVDAQLGGYVGLFSFMILVPLDVLLEGGTGLSLSTLGAKGIFLAVISSLIASDLYCRFIRKGFVIKMPEEVPEAISKSFMSLIPLVLTFLLFTLIRIIFSFTSFNNALDFVYKIIQIPLMGFSNNIFSLVIASVLIMLLWFFGLHGSLIVGAILDPLLISLSQENFLAIASGLPATNVINQQFYLIYFVSLGGGSCILIATIILAFFTNRKDMKELGKLGLPAILFNIAEPILFGLPMVLNPILFIPLVFTPIVTLTIGYIATVTGFAPIPYLAFPWTTPVILNGIISTNSIQGGIVQLICIIACFFIWFPFIKVLEKQPKIEEKDNEK